MTDANNNSFPYFTCLRKPNFNTNDYVIASYSTICLLAVSVLRTEVCIFNSYWVFDWLTSKMNKFSKLTRINFMLFKWTKFIAYVSHIFLRTGVESESHFAGRMMKTLKNNLFDFICNKWEDPSVFWLMF